MHSVRSSLQYVNCLIWVCLIYILSKKKLLKFYLFLDSNKSAYRLRATINRHLAVNALQRQRWTDFDNLSLNALEDYAKLYDRSKFKRNEVEIILHSGAMFMAFQFKPFEERAIKFEQIIKLCESVKVFRILNNQFKLKKLVGRLYETCS